MNSGETEYCFADYLSTVIVREITCNQAPGSIYNQQVSFYVSYAPFVSLD